MKKQTHSHNGPEILSAGKNWLAVDKPAGMSVHNDPGRDLCALLTDRLKTDVALQAATGLKGNNRLNAAHRLDRETSGILLLAGSRDALNHFAAQFETRKADKRYIAILHGKLIKEQDPKAWRAWEWSLTKTPGGRKDPRGKGPRKACTTLVRVLAHSEHYTQVECKLLTGRKHQIRRHAKLAGHPVVGDRRYGSKRALEFLQTNRGFTRLGLHATRLEIQLPDGHPTVIRSPELPIEIQRLFDQDTEQPI